MPGQNRPFPDTGVDFAGSYRFGLPFFLPVEDHDTRFQVNENVSLIRGARNIKLGFEFNRTNTVQTFIGFASGRYIFDSVQGFLNYVNVGPKFVECSDGTTSNFGSCPAGASITGPLLLYLQFTGVNGKSVNQAGKQSIPQKEPALFIQDKWQIKPNLHTELRLALGRPDYRFRQELREPADLCVVGHLRTAIDAQHQDLYGVQLREVRPPDTLSEPERRGVRIAVVHGPRRRWHERRGLIDDGGVLG